MDLHLRSEEVLLLRQILTSYLGDLRMEISNTDNYDFRQALKHREAMIVSLIARLGQAPETALA